MNKTASTTSSRSRPTLKNCADYKNKEEKMMNATRISQVPVAAMRRCLHSGVRRMAEQRSGGRERYLNRVTLLGRVGNMELRGKESSHPVLQMNVATNEYYMPKDSTEYVQATDWHRVKIFNPNIRDSVYMYASTGSRLLIEGKLKHSHYTDDNNVDRYETYVRADNVIFLSSYKEQESDE